MKYSEYVSTYGHGCWNTVPKLAGLQRCGKSCRLRWVNYLRPELKRGSLSPQETALIFDLQSVVGNKWAQIARHLPGRTDNDVKNFWNSNSKKKLMAAPGPVNPAPLSFFGFPRSDSLMENVLDFNVNPSLIHEAEENQMYLPSPLPFLQGLDDGNELFQGIMEGNANSDLLLQTTLSMPPFGSNPLQVDPNQESPNFVCEPAWNSVPENFIRPSVQSSQMILPVPNLHDKTYASTMPFSSEEFEHLIRVSKLQFNHPCSSSTGDHVSPNQMENMESIMSTLPPLSFTSSPSPNSQTINSENLLHSGELENGYIHNLIDEGKAMNGWIYSVNK